VKTDDLLEVLCNKFTDLEEPEKEYILGITQALAQLFFVINSKKHKSLALSPAAGSNID